MPPPHLAEFRQRAAELVRRGAESGVSRADGVGERCPQDMPEAAGEYSNWRVPLCGGEGRAVALAVARPL